MSRPTFRARKLEEVNRAYAEFLAGGFPCVLEGVAETLQCRNELDRTNWLTLIGICNEAIDQGAGDLPIPAPIRCTSNRFYALSFNDTLELMKALRAWAAAAQGNNWRMKDLVASAESNEDLRAVDLTEGWP
jgi:hypothetical protein